MSNPPLRVLWKEAESRGLEWDSHSALGPRLAGAGGPLRQRRQQEALLLLLLLLRH